MGGGGGGSSSNSARQMEMQRQMQIKARQEAIDRIFNDPSRQKIYDGLKNDVIKAGTYKLDREKSDSDRELMFSLARRGLTGSSVDADSRGRLAQNYLEQIRRIQDRGIQAANDLRLRDSSEKSRLYSLSTTGGDPASLAQQAAESLSTNAGAINQERYLSNIGGLLSNVGMGINKGLNTPGSGTYDIAKRINTYFNSGGSSNSGKITKIGG